jgi:hypothetical protein
MQCFVGDEYSKQWMIDNEEIVDCFLERYHDLEWNEIKRKMYNDAPLLTMRAIEDWDTPDEAKIDRIRKMMAEAKGEIWNVFGRKGAGKTATCIWLMELAREAGRECYVSGPPQKIPSWAHRVADPASAPQDSLVYISEAAIQYSSRTSMRADQRDALSIMPILRHSGRLILAESQSSRIIDVNMLRLMDVIVLKPEPLYSFDERHPMRHLMDILKPKTQQETLIFTGSWFTLIRNTPLPKCWDDDLSMPYKPIQGEAEAIQFAQELLDQDYSLAEVRRILIARSFNKPKWWWMERFVYEPQPAPVPVTQEPARTQKRPKDLTIKREEQPVREFFTGEV